MGRFEEVGSWFNYETEQYEAHDSNILHRTYTMQGLQDIVRIDQIFIHKWDKEQRLFIMATPLRDLIGEILHETQATEC